MNSIITQFAAKVNLVGDKADKAKNALSTNVVTILNNIIAVLGIACVIVMIIGGINYMTSSGDSTKVKKAKDTILYGLIGLVVCVLAFAIVNFVITNIIGNGGSTETNTANTTP